MCSSDLNEAVKLAKKRKFQELSGFINGVLRTVAREKDSLVFSEPHIRLSLPPWMLSMWEDSYGKETAERIGAAFLTERPLTVRCNETRALAEETMEDLKAQGIEVERSSFGDTLLSIKGYDYLEQVEAFRDGRITVQDESSALAGLVSGVKPGDFVLDVCSAPGGKALHAADLLRGTGTVEARDLTEYKISLVEENILRCGFQNIKTKVWDAAVFDPSMEEKADVVFADLPCSGLGIIGDRKSVV